MQLKRRGAVTRVFNGHTYIGEVEHRASVFSRDVKKWHAVWCGMVGLFKTKKEALSWLWMLHENQQAAQHLRQMKAFAYPVDNDNGLYDVLRSFAEGIGFTFIQEHEDIGTSKSLAGMVWQRDKKMYINESRMRIEKATTVAHELAHYYTYILGFYPFPFRADEQLAEAVAVAILKDYDIDCTHQGLSYIYHHSNQHHAFVRGDIDKAFVMVYNRFSRDLKAFLEKT